MQHLGRLCPSGVAALREEIVRFTRQLVQLGDETEPSLPQETLLRQLGERQLVESLSRELVLCDEEVERKRLLVENCAISKPSTMAGFAAASRSRAAQNNSMTSRRSAVTPSQT